MSEDTEDYGRKYRTASVSETGKIILDEDYEAYCLYRAQKFGKTQSYRMAMKDTSIENVNVRAFELENRPYIQERIKQIIEERARTASDTSFEEAISRYNDMYAMGQKMGGKDGLKIMMDAQKQLDKIAGFDGGKGGAKMKSDESPFLNEDTLQEDTKRIVELIRAKEGKDAG